jgi:hypothetical protein
MNANERELILKEEIHAIVGAAMEASNELEAGFLAAVYLSQPDIRVHSRPFAVKILEVSH